MYNKNSNRGNSFGKRSGGTRTGFSSGSRRTGGNQRRRFSNRRSGGGGKGRSQFSDVSKFVNKATPMTEDKPYQPVNSFADFLINDSLKQTVLKSGYSNPTPIQDQSIPEVLKGRDIVGIANTGTGKTAAFVIPLLDKVVRDRKQNIIILAPTRELAIQIDEELKKFAAGMRIFSVCAVGGMPIYRQIGDLNRNHNFVIGTPGRIKDLIQRGKLRLERFETIVLDEADRMLDMGFINDMRFLMEAMPEGRQTLFFSATLSDDIKRIINDFLNDPINISVKTRDTSSSIDQDVIRSTQENKFTLLHELLVQPEFNKVLIFGQTKRGVEKLSKLLAKQGVLVKSIHGDKNHGQRQQALRSFKNDSVKVLVATDVAARGIDIPNVTHVINYELPSTYEDYIHRIGRTGRGGNTGKALTFVSNEKTSVSTSSNNRRRTNRRPVRNFRRK